MDMLNRQYHEIGKELSLIKTKIDSTEKEIAWLKNDNVVVSDHAVIRYLERVEGMEIHKIRTSILSERVINQIKELGDGKYPIGDGKFRAIVKNNTVITIS